MTCYFKTPLSSFILRTITFYFLLSFIFAFYKGLKTFVYALVGLIILFVLNLFRIYVLNVIVIDYNEFTKPAHDYFFPAIIYGGVVLLWLIWINKFVIKEEVTERNSQEN